MNRILLFLLAGLCAMTSLISTAQDRPAIPLPSDPSTPIITMDWRGGYNAMGPRNVNPILTIRADGRVNTINPWGEAEPKETVLPPAEVQDLLHFAIVEQDFFSFNASEVKRAISAEFVKARIGVGIGDALDTIVHIRTADKELEATYNALEFWAQRYPSIKSLGQLHAIEVSLTRLIDDVKAGRK